MNPLNAKAKSKEIAVLLDEYIPGMEELMTKLKKTSKAAKQMRREIADRKKEANSSKASTLRQLELEKKVQELDDLQHMVEALQKTMDAKFLLENGNRVMIKRKLSEEYLDKATVI